METEPAIVVCDTARQTAFEAEIAALIVSALHLEVTPDAIGPGAPLFVDGLGLDSIDVLELALAISRSYGVELKSDEERNRAIFANLASLARHVEANQRQRA